MDETHEQNGALIDELARAGLIQFGQFYQGDGSVWPVWVNLRMAASYPALLRALAAAMVPLVGAGGADSNHESAGSRLLSTPEAIPLAVALSQQSDLPLVWPYGVERAYTAAFVYEGAYDVGHATILVTDVLADAVQARAIVALGERVGLVVARIIAALDLELGARAELVAAGVEVEAALRLGAMLPHLAASGWLPQHMHRTVSEWMKDGAHGR